MIHILLVLCRIKISCQDVQGDSIWKDIKNDTFWMRGIKNEER